MIGLLLQKCRRIARRAGWLESRSRIGWNDSRMTTWIVRVHGGKAMAMALVSKRTWLGHAGFLFESSCLHHKGKSIRILADAVFSDRTSPVSFLGPKRYTPPPCQLSDLPEIDVVITSHDHYDHLDIHTSQGSPRPSGKRWPKDLFHRGPRHEELVRGAQRTGRLGGGGRLVGWRRARIVHHRQHKGRNRRVQRWLHEDKSANMVHPVSALLRSLTLQPQRHSLVFVLHRRPLGSVSQRRGRSKQ